MMHFINSQYKYKYLFASRYNQYTNSTYSKHFVVLTLLIIETNRRHNNALLQQPLVPYTLLVLSVYTHSLLDISLPEHTNSRIGLYPYKHLKPVLPSFKGSFQNKLHVLLLASECISTRFQVIKYTWEISYRYVHTLFYG